MQREFFFIVILSLSVFMSGPRLAWAQETSENDLEKAFEPTPGPSEKAPKKSISANDDESETHQEAPPPAEPPPSNDDASHDEREDVGQNKTHKVCDCHIDTGISYRERRPRFTNIFGLEVGQYEPSNYTPQVGSHANQTTFGNYYGSNSSPNIEIVFGYKYNFLLGSIGLQLDGGYYSASNSADSASLTIYPAMLGATYQLDTLFSEPYVVPYVTGGVYKNFYNESAGGISVNGSSGVGMYYSLGLLFQLDWIDTEAHDSGYVDFGMENTFLFVEARSFLTTQNVALDFSTPLQFSGGFKFEF